MKKIFFLFFCLLFFGCKNSKEKTQNTLQLKFLDEFVLLGDLTLNGILVGGLSGIDYKNDIYYLACDDSSNPRVYEAQIDIVNTEIAKITIQKTVFLKDTMHHLDLESIRYDTIQKELLITSEGHIKNGKDPFFFGVDMAGNNIDSFKIPDAFRANSPQKPRHNGTLEGLSNSFDFMGYWIAMELPMEVDGPEPKTVATNSPVRITYIDVQTKKAQKQFAYKLDPIAKKPKDNFAVNGLTEILAYDQNKFFVIERSYSSGLGNQGNVIKIFNVDASKATNTLLLDNLKDQVYKAATKELLLNFEEIRGELTDNSIDNIEGITFGPILENGNRTLILVADNNFNKQGKQLNQFVLLEIVD